MPPIGAVHFEIDGCLPLCYALFMPRVARIVIPDVPYHITQRGNRREKVFFSDGDHNLYLKLLSLYGGQHGLTVKGYCLMTNHLHLAAVPEKADALCKVFKPVHLRYAQHVNAAHGFTGHVWQGRFFSCALDEAHYIRALRYVERNPVRAGMVERAEEYPWSSAAGHCGLCSDVFAPDAAWLTQITGDWRMFLAQEDLEEETNALRRHTRTGRPLGDETFLQHLESILHRSLRPKRGGRPRKSL